MSAPRVAVVIPTYQSAGTLPRALDSVRAQDFADLEIIVVDDGSTDETRAIVERYADRRIRYLYQANAGPASARNAGIAASTAPLIALLDADDEWLPGKLAAQVAAMDTYPGVGLIFTDAFNVDTATGARRLFSNAHPQMAALTMTPLDAPDVFRIDDAGLARSLYRRYFIPTSSMVFRRSAFEAVGGFNPALVGPEDADFAVRLAQTTRFAGWSQPRSIHYASAAGLSAQSERWLKALIAYHRLALRSPDYADLRDLARWNLRRTYRWLIIHDALEGRTGNALATFRASLRDVGLNPRIAGLTALALLGPAPTRWLGHATGRR